MWFDSVFHRLAQATFSLCLVTLFQQASQCDKKFLLQMIHAAPIELVGIRVLADGQSIYKPLLEIVLVLSQYSFHGIVQKL